MNQSSLAQRVYSLNIFLEKFSQLWQSSKISVSVICPSKSLSFCQKMTLAISKAYLSVILVFSSRIMSSNLILSLSKTPSNIIRTQSTMLSFTIARSILPYIEMKAQKVIEPCSRKIRYSSQGRMMILFMLSITSKLSRNRPNDCFESSSKVLQAECREQSQNLEMLYFFSSCKMFWPIKLRLFFMLFFLRSTSRLPGFTQIPSYEPEVSKVVFLACDLAVFLHDSFVGALKQTLCGFEVCSLTTFSLLVQTKLLCFLNFSTLVFRKLLQLCCKTLQQDISYGLLQLAKLVAFVRPLRDSGYCSFSLDMSFQRWREEGVWFILLLQNYECGWGNRLALEEK